MCVWVGCILILRLVMIMEADVLHVPSYKDYRNDVDYSLTPQFWLIMAARFMFIVLFEVRHCLAV